MSEINQIFRQHIQETVKDFPDLGGRLVIANIFTWQYEGNVDLEKAKFLSGDQLGAYLGYLCAAAKRKPSSIVMYDAPHDLNVIFFKGGLESVTNSKEQDIKYLLTHEVGHLVVKDAYKYETIVEKNFSECAADVFACIRHVQHFGPQSSPLDKVIWCRSSSFMAVNDSDHLTCFALEELKSLQEKIDFSSLTPAQTVELSWQIATRSALSRERIVRLNTFFGSLWSKEAKEKTHEEKLKMVAALICQENVDMDAFKVGTIFLRRYLDERLSFEGQAICTRNPEWEQIRKKLKEKEFRLARENGICLTRPANNNVPQKPPKSLRKGI